MIFRQLTVRRPHCFCWRYDRDHRERTGARTMNVDVEQTRSSKEYKQFSEIAVAVFGSANSLGLCLMLMCIVPIYAYRASSQILLCSVNIMLANLMTICASIPIRGIMINGPAEVTVMSCRFSVFFSEWGSCAVDIMFMYLMLDRVCGKTLPGRSREAALRAMNFSCYLSWAIGCLIAIPMTLVAIPVDRVGGVPADCLTPLSQSVLELSLKLCFIGVVPALVVASAIIEANFFPRRGPLGYLTRTVTAFYCMMIFVQIPYLIVRVVRSSSEPSADQGAIFYAEVFTRHMMSLRYVLIPIFWYLLVSDSPMDDIADFADLVIAKVFCTMCKKSEEEEDVGDTGPTCARRLTDAGRSCRRHVCYLMLKAKVYVSKMFHADHGTGVNEKDWTYPSGSLPMNTIRVSGEGLEEIGKGTTEWYCTESA